MFFSPSSKLIVGALISIAWSLSAQNEILAENTNNQAIKQAILEANTVLAQAELINYVDESVLELMDYWQRSSLDAVLDHYQKYARAQDEKIIFMRALSKLRSLSELECPSVEMPRFYDYRNFGQ